MNVYLPLMAAGTIVIFLLYGLYCSRSGNGNPISRRAMLTAVLALVLSVVIGTILARVGYAVMTEELDFESDGIEALLDLFDLNYDTVSFFCGAVGVCLGVLAANRLVRKDAVVEGMDAFAPFGALLAALFRMGEISFGSYGIGSNLPENSALAFFPFALKVETAGGYSYWGWAICVLSAFFALVWACISFLKIRDHGRAGLNFTLTLFFLCLTQILCESMRKRGIFWLFVHAEQLLCAVVVTGVMLYWTIGSKGVPARRRFMPLAVLAVCTGLLVATEFAIDGKLFDLSRGVCYAFMCLLIIAIGAAGTMAARNWNRAGMGEQSV